MSATLPVRRHEKDSGSPEKATIPLFLSVYGSRSGRPSSERSFLAALTVASLAVTILSTTFDLFYVETFLSAYELPLSSYAFGTLVYTIIDTANDFGGAWFVDAFDMRSSRGAVIIGRTGWVFAFSFLTPFFRGRRIKTSALLATAHFIVSLSLYDTTFTFANMLFGSMFTDDHSLSESTRINFMASGKLVNLAGSFLVGRVGLSVFDTGNLWRFRILIIIFCAISCGLFFLAQNLMRQSGKDYDRNKATKKLNLWQVVNDLRGHVNFRAWIAMEALLECQVIFSSTFLKVFVDNLLVTGGDIRMSEDTADWLSASIGPTAQVLGIIVFLPIKRRGYKNIYKWLFQMKIIFSLALIVFGSPQSTKLTSMFLVVNQIATAAVQTSCFYLVMSDLVAELKFQQAKGGRFDEPSSAGLLFGAISLCCKPISSLLPIIAAWRLAKVGFNTGTHTHLFKVSGEASADQQGVQQVLYHLLVFPPLILSSIQLLIWRRYTLGAARAEDIRVELKRLKTAGRRNNSGEINP